MLMPFIQFLLRLCAGMHVHDGRTAAMVVTGAWVAKNRMDSRSVDSSGKERDDLTCYPGESLWENNDHCALP
jgi:hypothetical protein